MKKSLVLLAVMSLSPAAFSQEYTGAVNDLNSIFNPPAEIQGTICAHTKNDGNEHSGDACRDGVSASRWMAEKYAKRAGKYLGCVDGFYQGIWDGYLQGKNPTTEMLSEAESYLAGAVMTSAVARGEQRADSNAVTESADEIINRYRDVLRQRENGNQVLPNKTPDLTKIPSFSGFDGGYEHDITQGNIEGGDFAGAISDGYVNSSSSFEDKIAARKAYYLQGQHAQALCDINQTIFGRRGMAQLTIWDYFKARRQYNFQNYGWKNGQWANEIYHGEEQTIAQYQNYEGFKNLQKDEPYSNPITEIRRKLDANGKAIPVLDEAGVQIVNNDGTLKWEMEEIITGYNTGVRRVKLNGADIKKLQNTYNTAFKEAYNRYYAKQYASIEYHVEGLAKYAHAKTIGQFIGEDVASNLAKKKAYDDKYKVESRSAYDKQAKDLYLESFANLINVFENNPVVELNDVEVVGSTNDNIFRRGEEVRVNFSVTNLGEVAAPVTMRIGSNIDMIGNQRGYTFTPVAHQRSQYNSSLIGQISNDAQLKSEVTVNMNVENPSFLNEVSRELQVSKSRGLIVRDYAEISRINDAVRLLEGQLDLKVDLTNPSSIATPALPKVRVVLHNVNQSLEKNILKISSGNTYSVNLNFTGLDPIELISKRVVRGTVYVTLGNNDTKVIDQKDFEVSVSGDAASAYANYFDALVTNKSSNTASSSRAKRIAELVKRIDQSVQGSLINDKIRWKKQAQVARTIIGDLQTEYRASKAAGFIDSSSQAEYHNLALLLAKKVNNKGQAKIRGLDKHYLRALKVFAPKLSTKWKDHRVK